MGFTALHGFAAKGDAEAVVECLQSTNSSVDARDSTRCTALHYACEKGHKKVVKLLRE
jgi:ankyrin repeat protein